jgi:hypothetical protein
MIRRNNSRREFLADVGKGMFLSTLGVGLATDLGLGAAWAAEEPGSLTFGDLDPLVAFIQDTPPDKIVGKAIEKIHNGTDLKQLVAAAGLANARAFGGEDYVGFHTLMALVPSYQMAAEEKDEAHKPLAVLKVLVRNATRLQEFGNKKETLTPVKPSATKEKPTPERLRDVVRQKDLTVAEDAYAKLAGSPEDALNNLMYMVDDGAEVHRVVLVSRSWDLLNFVGRDKAHTMLRQSVHYCVKAETGSAKYDAGLRELLPKLLDKSLVSSRGRGGDDAWVAKLADTIFTVSAADAAGAVAAALAEGFNPEAVGEAISLAANQLVLRDEGRPKDWAQPNKPIGSVHGDSIGVHACDSVLAWRNIARNGDNRTRVSSLILAGYQVARDRTARGEFVKWEPYPRAEHLEKIREVPAGKLMDELKAAILAKDQPRAAALTDVLCHQKKDVRPEVFALLRSFAISEDGALHAEKFYSTSATEFAMGREAFKSRYLVALARVTASAYGYPAPGYKDACGILKVS